MKLNVIKPKTHGKIDFINDIEVVKCNDKIYKLSYELKDVETLYSLPTNDKHTPYTKKKNISITDKMRPIIRMYWSIFKQGDIVEGDIKNNIFYVTR